MATDYKRVKHAQRNTEANAIANVKTRENRLAADTKRWISKLEDGTQILEAGYSVRYIERFSTLAAALTAFGSDSIQAVLAKSITLTGNATVPSNVGLDIVQGGSINLNGFTLTINGPFRAGLRQVFTGAGSVVFASGILKGVIPQWWGAVGDASTDDKSAFDAAAAAAYASGCALIIPKKVYYLSSWNLNALSSGLLIQGTGEQTQLKFGTGLSYGFRIDGGCRKVVMRDLLLNFPTAADQDCFQLGTSAGANQAYECAFHNITMTGNSGSSLQRGLVVEQAYIHQFYNCKILTFGTNITFKTEANSCNFFGCSIRAQSSNHIRLIDAQSGQQNTFIAGDIENAASWISNTGCEGLEFIGVYMEASNGVAIRLEAGYTKFSQCFLSEARAYVYEGGRCCFDRNRIRKTGTSFFLYFIHYAKLTFQAGGYVNFVAGDIGKTVSSAGGSGKLVSYDNALRTALIIPTADFSNGDAVTTSGGTGGGTLDGATGYTQNTPMTIPMFVAKHNRMEYTTPGSTTTGLFTRAFSTGVQSWKWDASGPVTATMTSNYVAIDQERIFDVNTSTLKTFQLSSADGLYLNGPVDANVGQSRMKTLAITQTTGTAPMSISSQTKVDNLNVDLLDGLDSTDFARRASVTATITGGTGWYRIASNGTVSSGGTGHTRAGAIFTIYDRQGGQHAIARFYAACLFGNQPTLILLHNSQYTSRRLTKVRLVYSTVVGSGEGVALDLEITGGSSEDIKVVMDENEGTTGWSLSDLSASSVPGGSYTTMELDLSTATPMLALSADGLANVFQVRRDGRISSGQVPTSTVPAQRHRVHYKLAAVNLNSAATDVGTFTGLPSKYRILRLTVYDASTSLTTATFDLRTASAGGGTALVSAFAPTACTAAAKYVDATLAAVVGTDYQTAGTLYVRNVTAQGGAATASFLLEIQDLT